MKKILLVFLIMTVNQLIAQSLVTVKEAEETIEELYTLKLLSEETKKILQQKLENKPLEEITSTKSQLFRSASFWEYHLYDKSIFFRTKKMRRKGANTTLDSLVNSRIASYWISYQDIKNEKGLWGDIYDYIDFHEKNFSDKEKQILRGLLEKNIINEIVYKKSFEILQDSYKGKFPWEILGKISDALVFYENYDKLKHEQIIELDNLKSKKKWLSESNYQKLLESYNPYQLHSYNTIVDNLDNAFAINLLDSFPDKPTYYKRILEKVKEKTLDFDYQNLEIKQIESEVYISLQVDGVSYKTSVYDKREDTFQNQMRISGILCLVNKFLADKDSDYRWFGRWIGTLADDFNPYYFPFLLSKSELQQIEDYSISQCLPLGSLQIERALQEMKGLDFFDYMSEKEFQEKKEQLLMTQEINRYTDILKFLENTIYPFVGLQKMEKNGKIIRPYSLYINLIENFVHISHEKFPAKNIFDTYTVAKKSKATQSVIGFELDGKVFEKMIPLYRQGNEKLKLDTQWKPYKGINYENIIELINEALEKTDKKIRLIKIENFGYLFLTPAQYQFLKEKEPDLFQE